MENKKANTTGVILVVLLSLILVGGVGFGVYYFAGNSQNTLSGSDQNIDGSGITLVTTDPVIQIAGTDLQQGGTAVTGSAQVATNGNGFTSATLGTTTAKVGQTLDILIVNNTAYHNAYYGKDVSGDDNVVQKDANGDTVANSINVKPGTFPIGVKFNKNGSLATDNIYSTTGVVMTTGGATNQTDLGNGASYNFKNEMAMGSLLSTQDMSCVVEVTAGVNLTAPNGITMSLNGANIAPKLTARPQWYTLVGGVDSVVYVFDVPALSSTATQQFYIGVNTKSTGRLPATSSVIRTCYTKEYFIDSQTGKVAYDVADSLNAIKSMASYTKRFYFQ